MKKKAKVLRRRIKAAIKERFSLHIYRHSAFPDLYCAALKGCNGGGATIEKAIEDLEYQLK